MSAVDDQPGDARPGALFAVDTRFARTVAGLLRDRIVSGELAPGARLVPADIAAELGVSRGPVREAIAELVGQGLVVQEPRRAAYVRGLSSTDVTQLSLLRGVLEALAVRLACESVSADEGDAQLARLERIISDMRQAGLRNDAVAVTRLDNEFHGQLVAMARFPTLSQILASLSAQFRPLISAANAEMDAATVWTQHQPFLDALRGRDSSTLQSLAADHARAAGNRILSGLAQRGATTAAGKKRGQARHPLGQGYRQAIC